MNNQKAQQKMEDAGLQNIEYIEGEGVVYGEWSDGSSVEFMNDEIEGEVWFLDDEPVGEKRALGASDVSYWIAKGNTYPVKDRLNKMGCRFEGAGVVGGCYWWKPGAEKPEPVDGIEWKPIYK